MKTKVNYLPRFQDIPGKPGVNNLGGVWVPVSDQVHGPQLLEWVHLVELRLGVMSVHVLFPSM